MRLLFFTGTYPPETGGIATLVHGLAMACTDEHAEVRVLRADGPGEPGRVPIETFELPSHGYVRRVLACRRAVAAAIADWRPERIVVSSWSPFAVGLPRGPAIDILCHGMDILEPARSWRYRRIMRRTLERADRLIANSAFTADTIAQAAPGAVSRIVVIPPGVDAGRFSPDGRERQGRRLLSVGRLIERKGFDLVLRALPELARRHNGISYTIAGDGPDRRRLETLARSLDVTRLVRFAVAPSPEEVVELYRASDVFVMPNRSVGDRGDVEGFGIVFLEAAAAGLPVVGGRAGGAADAVGGTGFLVDPGSVEELTEVLSRLLADSELRRAAGAAARQRVIQQFSWRTAATRLMGIREAGSR